MIDREALRQAIVAADEAYLASGAEDSGAFNEAIEAAITAYLTHAGEGAVSVGWQADDWQIATARQNANEKLEVAIQHGSVTLSVGWLRGLAQFLNHVQPVETWVTGAAPHPPRQDGAREFAYVDGPKGRVRFDLGASRQDGAREGELVERIAEWLHGEVEWPDPDFPQYSWPEHEDDTGQRGDGFLKIVPRDTREQFRDIARRLALFFAPATTPPAPDEAVAAERLITEVEARFPNWRSYRDLIDCIDCTLHDLRSKW